MVRVALDGIESILRVGKDRAATTAPGGGGGGFNVYAQHVDEAGGLDLIEQLQVHPSDDIYHKAVQILEAYFGLDADPALESAHTVSAVRWFALGV